MYGIDVAYFRAIPHPTGEDVIFQNYTLYDVESCPTSVKLLFSDTSYAVGDYMISALQLDYNVPLVAQVAAKTWFEAFGTNTMPQ